MLTCDNKGWLDTCVNEVVALSKREMKPNIWHRPNLPLNQS